MARFHFRDNLARRAANDQEAAESMVAEIMERLDRLEQGLTLLAQRDNGDEGNADQSAQPQPRPTTRQTTSPKFQQMGDELLPKGNLSRVDAGEYDMGQAYPDDFNSSTTYDTAQTLRDRFMSRNEINGRVVSINARNRQHYHR
jgi:hypothetical protein